MRKWLSSEERAHKKAGGPTPRGPGRGKCAVLTADGCSCLPCKDTGVTVVNAAAVQDQGDAVQLADLQRKEKANLYTEKSLGHTGDVEDLLLLSISLLIATTEQHSVVFQVCPINHSRVLNVTFDSEGRQTPEVTH